MYIRISKEDIEKAKNVDLIELLESKYPNTIEYNVRKKSYRHAEHDSLVINGDFWYQFSRSRGGDQISFLMEFCNKTFAEAVKELSDFCEFSCNEPNSKVLLNAVLSDEDIIFNDFQAPERNVNENYVKRYLFERGIALSVIHTLIRDNLLYEDVRKNCVFYNSNLNFYILRGTGDEKWTKIIREVANSYWFFTVGENPKDVFVCESPIDALSLYRCNNYQKGIYCAMAGVKKNTYLRIINDLALDDDGILCKNLKIAVDWDEAGNNFIDNIIDTGYPFCVVRPSNEEMKNTKDWNDVLLLRKKRDQL